MAHNISSRKWSLPCLIDNDLQIFNPQIINKMEKAFYNGWFLSHVVHFMRNGENCFITGCRFLNVALKEARRIWRPWRNACNSVWMWCKMSRRDNKMLLPKYHFDKPHCVLALKPMRLTLLNMVLDPHASKRTLRKHFQLIWLNNPTETLSQVDCFPINCVL